MAIVVSLKQVVGEMDVANDEFHAYLNQVTGEIVSINDEDIHAIESGEAPDDYPEWQQEALATAKKVWESTDYLALPSKFDIHEYAIMERFCYSIEDSRLSNELSDLLRGSGAFRRFKDAIRFHDIEDQWYRFREQALEEIAIDWLESHGIAFTRLDTPE